MRCRNTEDVTLTATDAFQQERPRLTGIAFRILGTIADAEDAVQETYLRWHALSEPERSEIRAPAAWLTRVASRICLDQLGTARARREQYVGEWLPEPVPAAAAATLGALAASASDPLETLTLGESVSTALLVVMESLSPAERVAFVLHDVFAVPFAEISEIVGRAPDACRQLTSAARRHVRDRRAGRVSPAQHDAAVRAFVAACQSGDVAVLAAVLDPAIELRSDGGGFVSAARRPVVGAVNVARFLLGILQKEPDARVEATYSSDGLALTISRGGGTTGVVNLGVTSSDTISDVWIMLNPEKLTLWR